MSTMSPNTVALNVLNVLKNIGRKKVPVDYVAQSVNRPSEEVMPVLSKLAQEDVVELEGEHVTLL